MGQNFENLVFGNWQGPLRKDVHGVGNAAGNWLVGGEGTDTLEGKGGADSLSGGFGGHDLLIGGAGHDTFAFGHGNGSSWVSVAGGNSDVIGDFDPAMDRISLAPWAFAFIGRVL